MSGGPIVSGIGRLLSPAGSRGRLAVFCYHQVLESPDAIRSGEPTEQEFAADVERIASAFTVLTFGDAVARLAAGTLPPRAACLTFDDGYANNYSLAAPVLEKAGIPATIFVAGGAVDEGVMWNDVVIESVAAAGGWPRIPEAADFLAPPERGKPLAQLAEHLLGQLKYRPLSERWEVARGIYEETVGEKLPRLMMGRDDVRELAARGFEIGGHTINHPILKELPDDEARAEIEGCRRWVEEVTSTAPMSFAYPNGRSGVDFDDRHIAMVRDAGFAAAASTDWGLATAESDVFSLPRTGPWWRQGRQFHVGLIRSYLRSYV